MTKLKALVAVIGLTALIAIGAACGSDEARPETAGVSPLPPPGLVTPAPQEPIVEPGDTSSGPVTSTMLVPRPESIEVLVRMCSRDLPHLVSRLHRPAYTRPRAWNILPTGESWVIPGGWEPITSERVGDLISLPSVLSSRVSTALWTAADRRERYIELP